jgi:hypothetical protein
MDIEKAVAEYEKLQEQLLEREIAEYDRMCHHCDRLEWCDEYIHEGYNCPYDAIDTETGERYY